MSLAMPDTRDFRNTRPFHIQRPGVDLDLTSPALPAAPTPEPKVDDDDIGFAHGMRPAAIFFAGIAALLLLAHCVAGGA